MNRHLTLDRQYEAETRRRAAQRVRRAFGAQRIPVTCYWGLGRIYSQHFIDGHRCAIPHESGWRARRILGRDAVTIVPLWLALVLDVWDARYGAFRLAIRLGVWSGKEGDRYVDGRLTAPLWLRRAVWCFLHDTDAVGLGGPGRPNFSDRPIACAPFYGLTPRQYEAGERIWYVDPERAWYDAHRIP